jgi:hypothetical protein
MPEPLDAEQIRIRYLSSLRALYRLTSKIEPLYPEFPDAPADVWRVAISSVAAYIKSAPKAELLTMGGSHTILRNLVATTMGLGTHDGRGGSEYGHKLLDIRWE